MKATETTTNADASANVTASIQALSIDEKKGGSKVPSTSGIEKKPQVVFVLGGPGAGKGTQCAKIVKSYGFVHLSAGDLLRAERQSGSSTANLIDTYIKEGKIVPVEITVGLLKAAMQKNIEQGKRLFLVDGFPRNFDNLTGWRKVMDDFADVRFCLFFDCPENVMEQRLLIRGQTSGRTDDNIESIKKRFKTYEQETLPVLADFEKQGKVRKVSAVPPENEVFAEVERVFGEFNIQTTFAFIKPDVVEKKRENEVLQRIRSEGFQILEEKRVQLTEAEATRFYSEHIGKSFFANLISFMTSGPAIALALRAPNAILAWRATAGPTKTEVAKQQAPDSIRALFGTDGTKNAVHGSDSVKSANRELNLLFPNNTFSNKSIKKIIIMGAPASGKGTQCEFIKEKYGVCHISTGDLLRSAVSEGTELGLKAKAYMDEGKLVPDEIIIGIVHARLENKECQKQGWLLDGFPRTEAQAEALKKFNINPDYFLQIDVPDEILTERVVGRRLDPVTGSIYHLKFSPPPNEEISKRLVQRSDDTEEKVKVRIGAYHKHIDAIQKCYASIVTKINGVGDPKAVFQQIVDTIGQ